MTDPEQAQTQGASLERPKLVYPFEVVPEGDRAVAITPDVLWMRLPLAGSLAFINVWAIRDGDGWALVDTGIHNEDSANTWRGLFKTALEQRPASRIIATHLHPDHIGLAGWLTRRFGCRLWMTRLEYLQCRMLVADTGREAPQDGIEFYRAAGWTEDSIETYRTRFGGFGKAVYQMPDSYRRIHDSEEIDIGGHIWRVVVGNGHSPEHACLYCPELKLLIAGDQVLPKISSNVSVFPTEPDGDPLTDWLTSLARIKHLVPDDVLVLPSHNEPFHGLHARLDHLIAGHERRLTRLISQLAEPKRVVDVFPAIFARQIQGDLLGLATGETLAHLNCLLGRGQAVVSRDAAGVAWYRTASEAVAA